MKSATLALLASAAVLANGQVTYNNNTGKYTCDRPNVAYCAGDSLRTDIIFRCDSQGNAQPGRCSDNLAGEPPVGVNLALCFQTSQTSGDASCEKNCVVYGASGNGNGTFTLPPSLCNATYTPTSSFAAPTSVPVNVTTSTRWITTTTCDSDVTGCTTTVVPITEVPTEISSTTAPCTTVASTGVIPVPKNQTEPASSPASTPAPAPTSTFVTATTHVPTGPTTTTAPPQVTAGASSLQMGGSVLAAVGLIAAYLL